MVNIPLLSRRSATAPTRDENGDGRVDERDAMIEDSRTARTAPVVADPVVTDRDTDRTTYRSGAVRDLDGDGDGRLDRDRGRLAAEQERVEADRTVAAQERAEANRAAAVGVGTAVVDPPTTVRHDVDTHRDLDTGRDVARDRRLGTRPDLDTRRDVDGDGIDDRVDVDRSTTGRVTTGTDQDVPPVDRTDPEPGRPVEPTVVGPRPRASLFAMLSLIVGVSAALFVLTGTLAGYGIALGVLGAVLAFGGFSATRRRHVAGRSDALFGLLLSLGAILIGILAFSGQYDWPNADADTVARFREWLDSQFVDRF